MKTITNIHSTYTGDPLKKNLITKLNYEYSIYYYNKPFHNKPGFSLGFITRALHLPSPCSLEHHNTVFQHTNYKFNWSVSTDALDRLEFVQQSSSNPLTNSETAAIGETYDEDTLSQISFEYESAPSTTT